MANENEPVAALDGVRDDSSDAPESSAWSGVLSFIGLFFVLGIIMVTLMTLNASAHPYSGTGVVKSHTPWGSAMCNITVNESTGGEHTYQRTGGLPYCAGVVDGSTVIVESGVIKSITAP